MSVGEIAGLIAAIALLPGGIRRRAAAQARTGA
jgi:hypothetical protein